jgi:hypothetical protein
LFFFKGSLSRRFTSVGASYTSSSLIVFHVSPCSHARPSSLQSTKTFEEMNPLDFLDPLGVKPKPPPPASQSAALVAVENEQELADTLIPGPLNTWPNTKRDVPFEINWNGEHRKDKIAACTQRKTYDGYERHDRVTLY